MKGKVLVIEDLKIWQIILKEALESDGFVVTLAKNLKEALELIKTERFHFITIDMKLDENSPLIPDALEGWDVLNLLRKHDIDKMSPTMIISGYTEDYEKLLKPRKIQGLFIMNKTNFSKNEFLTIVNREVKRTDLRFYGDQRD